MICFLNNFLVLQALSVGIFPYVLKLLQTTTTELRQILVFIWTKILALDKVYASGHSLFKRFYSFQLLLSTSCDTVAIVLQIFIVKNLLFFH